MKLQFLGTGTSHGIPVIGCSCPVCRSNDPRNIRSRSSITVSEGEHRILIDIGPDFRTQMLTSGIAWIDAVFLTHDHADHLNGLDDIRVFTWHRVMPFYAAADVCRQLRQRFSYIFGNPMPGGGVPNLDLQEMGPGKITIGEMEIIPVPIMHGDRVINGYRIGNMAYLTDCSGIPSESHSLLQGLDVLIIGALRYRPHPTHFSIDQAVAAAKTIGAKQTYLTHLCHDVEHSAILQDLPATVSPAYDGLTLEL